MTQKVSPPTIHGMNLDNVPEHVKPALIAANAGKPLASLESPDLILQRLQDGESPMEIAQSLGVSDVALYKYLVRNCPDDWQAVSAARSLAKIEKAERELDSAELTPDSVSVSRSRESARLAMWNLERVARKMYGQRDESANGVNIQVVIAPYSPDGAVIDVTPKAE